MNNIFVRGTIRSFAPLAIFVCLLQAGTMRAQSVITWHNDQYRTGQNLKETILTPANVNASQFGKVFSYPVDGQIYAQPLYVPNVNITGKGKHNTLYVATENDSVYAFDADTPGAPLWFHNFTNPPTVLPIQNQNCVDPYCTVVPVIGITGTPVITPSTQTLYVVTRTQETTTGKLGYYTRLHALDIRSGADKAGSPALICGAPVNTPGCVFTQTTFNPKFSSQRSALLLLPFAGTAEGVLYIGFAGQSSLLAFDASTLARLADWVVVPNIPVDPTTKGGIWGSGGGLAGDSLGNLYVSTGDGYFNVNAGGSDYGDSVIKLTLTPKAGGGFQFQVLDYFTPADAACRGLNDIDLGSGSPMILPQQPGTSTNLLVIAGKGNILCDPASPIEMVNRDAMGHFAGQLQAVAGAPGGYWGAPAYWDSAAGPYLYYAGQQGWNSGEYLRQYGLFHGQISPATSIAQSPAKLLVGATPSVSANGKTNGVVWAIERQETLPVRPGSLPAILHAYSALNVATELYNSGMNPARDKAGVASKFMVPTIINGKVYVATQSEVDVYGLLPAGEIQ